MSKRIFTPQNDPSPLTANGRTPNCYYHSLPITHFCTKKKCTLPICAECLPIHKKEHIKSKEIAMDGIVGFEEARGEALKSFGERREEIVRIQEGFKNRIDEFHESINNIVASLLQTVFQDAIIADGNVEILNQIDERTSQIRQGSLKEMIKYYEDTFGAQHFRKLYKMYFGDYLKNYKFQIDKNKIQDIVQRGIINENVTVQIHTNKHSREPRSPGVPQNQQFYATSQEIATPITSIKQMVQDAERAAVKRNQQQQEEDQQSEISSYKLLKQRNKRGVNIYTEEHEKNVLPSSSFPSSQVSNSQYRRSSSSKGRRKKGLSLAKSHQNLHLGGHTNQSFKSSELSEEFKKKNSWRDFINMGGTNGRKSPRSTIRQHAFQSSNSRLRDERMSQIDTKPLLDPRQMRQLIIKKKIDEKNKERDLRVSRSRELLIPVAERTE